MKIKTNFKLLALAFSVSAMAESHTYEVSGTYKETYEECLYSFTPPEKVSTQLPVVTAYIETGKVIAEDKLSSMSTLVPAKVTVVKKSNYDPKSEGSHVTYSVLITAKIIADSATCPKRNIEISYP